MENLIKVFVSDQDNMFIARTETGEQIMGSKVSNMQKPIKLFFVDPTAIEAISTTVPERPFNKSVEVIFFQI